jgi:hypothetical protein
LSISNSKLEVFFLFLFFPVLVATGLSAVPFCTVPRDTLGEVNRPKYFGVAQSPASSRSGANQGQRNFAAEFSAVRLKSGFNALKN